ncbi:MAG TPA: gliding motility-associated C-terminal domain-containing protein, partial [Flavobacteriales bacterium]|nr:gliding motility-associated C-terminal domain-containing protein [Flavobacteriales bacterium]
DTACAEVRVPLGAGLFVPDAFTPNGDGVNDVFTPIVNGVLEEGYRFMVFDRWGLEIFSTERPGTGWNGELDGMEAPVDVYVWKVTGRERYGTGHVDRMGHVTLMR